MLLHAAAMCLTVAITSATSLDILKEASKIDKDQIEVRLIIDVEMISEDSPVRYLQLFNKFTLSNFLDIFQHEGYNLSLPLLIVLHGFSGNAEKFSPMMHAFMKNGYREKYNFVVLNMPLYFERSLGNFVYVLPALRAKLVGEELGRLLNMAVDGDLLTPQMINLLGFSLGAQMAGYVARTFDEQINFILGLDPAGPGFDTSVQSVVLLTHVSRSDARVVHMYHTNSNTFGSMQRLATADFVFNNGWHQPGCLSSVSMYNKLLCSHRRSMAMIPQILNNPGSLQALRCSNYWRFTRCLCRDKEVIDLTFPPDPRANGTYYLTTKDKAPYGEGTLGSMCRADRLRKLQEEGLLQPSLYDKIRNFRPNIPTLRTFQWRLGSHPHAEDKANALEQGAAAAELVAEVEEVDDFAGEDEETLDTTNSEKIPNHIVKSLRRSALQLNLE